MYCTLHNRLVFHGFDLLRREEDGGIGLLIEEEDLDCGHDHRDHHDPEDGDADAEVLPHLHCTVDHLDHLDHDDHHYHLVLVLPEAEGVLLPRPRGPGHSRPRDKARSPGSK